jgi:hypothetical protein
VAKPLACTNNPATVHHLQSHHPNECHHFDEHNRHKQKITSILPVLVLIVTPGKSPMMTFSNKFSSAVDSSAVVSVESSAVTAGVSAYVEGLTGVPSPAPLSSMPVQIQ